MNMSVAFKEREPQNDAYAYAVNLVKVAVKK